jgi:starch-binding outer membrane protein SusE/F
MKNNFLKLCISFSALLLLWSCEKEENKIFYEGGTNPVLTSSRTGTIPLSFGNKDQEAVKIAWTNPDYRFTTGLSSQTVAYQIEIDTTGANFTNPKRKIISISQDLSLSISQNDLNDYLLNQLQLTTGVSHNIEMRVTSTIGTAVPLYSNILKFTVTPYVIPPKVTPPSTGKLFIVGNATPGGDATGWNNPVPVPTQQFTQISNTVYEITIPLIGDKSYLFLPENGSWTVKYGAIGANNTNNVNGDDFKAGGGDMKAPAASGTYKIEVDFQRGKFTVTKL